MCRCAEEGSTYMGGGSRGEWGLGNEEIFYSFKNALGKTNKQTEKKVIWLLEVISCY